MGPSVRPTMKKTTVLTIITALVLAGTPLFASAETGAVDTITSTSTIRLTVQGEVEPGSNLTDPDDGGQDAGDASFRLYIRYTSGVPYQTDFDDLERISESVAVPVDIVGSEDDTYPEQVYVVVYAQSQLAADKTLDVSFACKDGFRKTKGVNSETVFDYGVNQLPVSIVVKKWNGLGADFGIVPSDDEREQTLTLAADSSVNTPASLMGWARISWDYSNYQSTLEAGDYEAEVQITVAPRS